MIASKHIIIRYRAVGTLVVFAALALLAFAFKAIYDDIRSTIYLLRVELPQVGTLDPQNPVYYRGVQIGMVQSVKLQDNIAIATLQFEEPIKLRAGSRVVSKTNGGVLGGRFMYITPSDTGAYLSDSALVLGEFEPSLVETMHKLHDVVAIVQQVSDLVAGIKNDQGGRTSLSVEFWSLYGSLREMLDRATDQLDHLQKPLLGGLNQVNAGTAQALDLANSTNRQFREIYSLESEYLPKVDTLLAQVNSVAAASEMLLDSLERSPVYAKLLNDRKLLESVHGLSQQVARVVEAVRTGEIVPGMGQDPLIKLENIHIFRKTAHDQLQIEKRKDSTKK